jgi:hypothetical protein
MFFSNILWFCVLICGFGLLLSENCPCAPDLQCVYQGDLKKKSIMALSNNKRQRQFEGNCGSCLFSVSILQSAVAPCCATSCPSENYQCECFDLIQSCNQTFNFFPVLKTECINSVWSLTESDMNSLENTNSSPLSICSSLGLC